jgi:hypothetical protein
MLGKACSTISIPMVRLIVSQSHNYMNQTDYWGGCTPDTSNTRCDVGDYKEDTISYFGEENMIIYEPCNYVSNLAFYHSATRICDYPDWSVDDDQIKG